MRIIILIMILAGLIKGIVQIHRGNDLPMILDPLQHLHFANNNENIDIEIALNYP